MQDLPDGVVTFLFTDVEGSTPLWEEAPDSMMDALRVHDEAARVLERDREVMDPSDFDAAEARGRAVPIAVTAKELLPLGMPE